METLWMTSGKVSLTKLKTNHIIGSLMWCVLHGAALEATDNPHFSGTVSYGHCPRVPYNHSALCAALVVFGFWLQFKVFSITYKILHNVGPGHLRGCLSPVISSCLIWCGRVSMVWDPAIKQCWICLRLPKLHGVPQSSQWSVFSFTLL